MPEGREGRRGVGGGRTDLLQEHFDRVDVTLPDRSEYSGDPVLVSLLSTTMRKNVTRLACARHTAEHSTAAGPALCAPVIAWLSRRRQEQRRKLEGGRDCGDSRQPQRLSR
jgi:hypothetical protein